MRKILFLFVLIVVAGFITYKDKVIAGGTGGKDDAPVIGKPIILGQDDFIAYYADIPPVIDGNGDDPAWAKAKWQDIKYAWMYKSPMSLPAGAELASDGTIPKTADFSGRFKVVWTSSRLYILAEIIDDIIYTPAGNPTQSPEKNDCLELFIDENASGGVRGSDGGNNFFTYHLNFDGVNVADWIGSRNVLRNSHLNYKINKNDDAHTYTWEIEMKVYDSSYPLGSTPDLPPVTLTEGKKMGFAAAYCDNDKNAHSNSQNQIGNRDHFIGSMFVTGGTDNERNSSYLNSSQYAKLYLVREGSNTIGGSSGETSREPSGEPSIVSLVQSTKANASDLTYADIKALVTEAVALAGGLEGIIKTGDTVVLKPNVIFTKYNWNTSAAVIPMTVNGVCTDWRVMQATAELVRAIIGPAGKILVIEGSGKGSTAANFVNIGYTPANLSAVDEIIPLDNEGSWAGAGNAAGAQANYVIPVALDNHLYKKAPAGKYAHYYKNGTYYINKKMYDADALICLPVVKNHWHAVVTGAIKNISIGAAPPRIYGNSGSDIGRNNMVNHDTVELHQWIADYFSCLPADFVIMDGLQGLQNGPLPGGSSKASALTPNQKNLRCILASRDALAIDTVETNIINWDYTTVKYLSFLNHRGEAGTKPGKPKITLRGDTKDIVVLGNKKVDDIRTNYKGNLPMAGGEKLTEQKLAKPAITITSAAFSGQNLNLNLALSSGANDNVVKIDVYIDGVYKKSFNTGMANVSLDASSLSVGSHNIEVRAYTKFMSSDTKTTTAVK